MSDGDEAVEVAKRRRRPVLRMLPSLVILLAVAVALLWVQRRPIATGFVDRELARRGVPARYRIAEVGFRTQRLTDVVIGDPADPDLTADWIEVTTRVGFSGAAVEQVAVGRAWLRARIVGGRVSLGVIDRLLPPPSGKPFALPAIGATLEDVRVRLETAAGPVGLKLRGRGRLSDGWRGQVAAVAPALAVAGCRAEDTRLAAELRVTRGAPTLAGPFGGTLLCGADGPLLRNAEGRVQVALSERLDRWSGRVDRIGAEAVRVGNARIGGVGGALTFAGDARRTAGTLDLRSRRIAFAGVAGQAGAVAGQWQVGAAGAGFAGSVRGTALALDEAGLRGLAGLERQGAGTPVEPLVRRFARAAMVAGRRFDADAQLSAATRGGGGVLTVRGLQVSSVSGARIALASGEAAYRWPRGGVALDGVAVFGGGGLPGGRVQVVIGGDGTARGTAVLERYASGDAALALAPVRFVGGAGGPVSLATTATLSAPVAGGRVDGLRLPIDARWRGAVLSVNPGCAPVAWQRLAVSGLVLDPARLTVCPTGAALVSMTGGRIGGGARIAAPRLTGRLGSTPLSLAASSVRVELGTRSFSLDTVAARLGAPERITRIDANRITGRLSGGGVTGAFAGLGGQIGAVPLVLSEGAGEWHFRGDALTLGGRLQVADAATAARFRPLASDNVRLTLRGSAIAAGATLRTPATGVRVADVAIAHDLARGAGQATLEVPGITFAEGGLQPEQLTPLTFGVIAAVNGTVRGRGDIAWSPEGVTSTGRFRADNTSLAAAFGPVTGINTELEFTDLLGLVSARGQVASVAVVNPGVPVENGTLRYRLLGGNRVAVEGARWPFAGGELVLEPTTLDFNAEQERRMTFRVTGVDAAQFLQQFDFQNLNATGTFDGVLPMVFDASGGRIEGGRLVARSGGAIAYVGELTQEDLGVWGNIAFQALKALNYRNLEVTMNGPLAGEMITQFNFAGISQGEGTRSNFLIKRLARLPFVFNVTVRAPFRQLVDSVQGWYDPARLIQRNLPALIEEQKRPAPPTPVQPPESEKRP